MNHKQAEKSGIVNALTNTKKQWSHCDILGHREYCIMQPMEINYFRLPVFYCSSMPIDILNLHEIVPFCSACVP